MKMTKHATERSQQRSLPLEALEVVMRHGRVSYASGGVEKLFFGNKECADAITELKKVIKTLERAKGGTIILNNENIITVYKQH
ncbi:hypothetical protein [Desulforhopalus singaporensis]|uniref:DUF4258 domain-containing protein n=1 Tax=Desulforhopalus singaporensis TaxID=91360 RepID=A0A1H0R117_9BACT|nr:hypothetical protein [Desulforhopalus singaporensis]SDP23045.1 hypothetical protein SAMN05660330_02162 [Desulforhopalus singaporensis]